MLWSDSKILHKKAKQFNHKFLNEMALMHCHPRLVSTLATLGHCAYEYE